MSERTSGTHPRCLFYGGTVIKEQPLSQGSLLPIPSKQERERERETPWLGLVTCLQKKIYSEGGVLCLSILCLACFHRFASPTTITETMENFCLNRTATR